MVGSATVQEALIRLRSREQSATELLDAVLCRLKQTEPAVRAYVEVFEGGAREAATRADHATDRGALHGIPFGVKDVFCTTDAPTRAGSRFLSVTGQGDAAAVARLRRAGGILVGKQVTHEFTAGLDTAATRNPWQLDHYPGGSSAGGAVSVAVGSSLFALGTDAAGSVRKPAALVGVVGFKPTFGRISAAGVVRAATTPSLDHVGILARTAEDIAVILPVIAGHDPEVALTLRKPVGVRSQALDSDLAGLRVGVPSDDVFGSPPDAAVRDLVGSAIEQLEQLGVGSVDVPLPAMTSAAATSSTISAAELARAHRGWLGQDGEQYTDETRRFLERGLRLERSEVDAAHEACRVLRRKVDAAFAHARLAAIATPTVPCTAMPLGDLVPARDMPRLVQYTCPWNLTGHPAISIPCGFTADGLPVGLQLVGRFGDETTILRLAEGFQRATSWHLASPLLTGAASARSGILASAAAGGSARA